MADFEHHSETAANICMEIERKLAVLGIDWHDSAAMKELAHDCLGKGAGNFEGLGKAEPGTLTRMELHGLIGLMLRTMEESATDGQELHGSDSWKALAKALWEARGSSR